MSQFGNFHVSLMTLSVLRVLFFESQRAGRQRYRVEFKMLTELSTQDFCRDSTLPVCNVRSDSLVFVLSHPELGPIEFQPNPLFSFLTVAHNRSIIRPVSYWVTKLEMSIYQTWVCLRSRIKTRI